MLIPHKSRFADIKAEGEEVRKKEREQYNTEVKQQATMESNSKFTEDFVAQQITEAIRDGRHSTTFKTIRYKTKIERGEKEEYIKFPSAIMELVKSAGWGCTHQYVDEFVVFFTEEAERKYS